MRGDRWMAAAFAAGLVLAAGQAMAKRGDPYTPASLPPAGFKGAQFVDSDGCIFVRAGYGGQVTWVPRFTDARKPMCGYKPTFAGGRAADPVQKPAAVAAPAPPAPTGAPVRTPAPQPAAPARVAAPAPVPPPAPVAPKPAAAPVVLAQDTRQAPPTACPNLSPGSQPYMHTHAGHPVRCGPQAGHPGDQARPNAGRAPVVVTPPNVVPSHVMPPGYKAAWEDGRLNPHRARGTAAGQASMNVVWTESVPRRLNPDPALRPVLVDPYRTAAATPQPVKTAPAARVSTKTAPQAVVPAAKAAPAGRYVQVGTFGVPANAEASGARIGALGLPVARSTLNRKGQALTVVMAGPFASAEASAQALAALRGAGFRDAFLR